MDAAVGRHDRLEEWLTPFRFLFTRPTWQRLMVLAAGAILTTHRRRMAAVLRVTGRAEAAGFSRYHDVLSRADGLRWRLPGCFLYGWSRRSFPPGRS